MKKTERMARGIGATVAGRAEGARDWAVPRVEAAVNWAVPRLERGIDTASPKIQEGLHRAASELAGGVAWATPRVQEGLEKVGPRISRVVDDATPAIQHARDRVVHVYIPAASAKLGEAADYTARRLDGTRIPQPVHQAVAAVSGDKKSVARAQKAAAEAAKHAAKQLRKAQKREGRRRGLLVFGIIAAAVTAGIAAWRASKPVEDPWKAPAPVEPAPVPQPAVETEASAAEVRQRIADSAPTGQVPAAAPGPVEAAATTENVDADLARTEATRPGPRRRADGPADA